MSAAFWTDERVETLKALWAEGYSASRISAHFQGEVSRSAVCAKISRLYGTPGVQPRAGAPRREQAQRAKGVVKLAVVNAAPPPLNELPAARDEDGTLITVMNARNHHCRWPIGDPVAPDFHFCGHAKTSGSPYCEIHTRKAWQGKSRTTAEERAKSQEAMRSSGMLRAIG